MFNGDTLNWSHFGYQEEYNVCSSTKIMEWCIWVKRRRLLCLEITLEMYHKPTVTAVMEPAQSAGSWPSRGLRGELCMSQIKVRFPDWTSTFSYWYSLYFLLSLLHCSSPPPPSSPHSSSTTADHSRRLIFLLYIIPIAKPAAPQSDPITKDFSHDVCVFPCSSLWVWSFN